MGFRRKQKLYFKLKYVLLQFIFHIVMIALQHSFIFNDQLEAMDLYTIQTYNNDKNKRYSSMYRNENYHLLRDKLLTK